MKSDHPRILLKTVKFVARNNERKDKNGIYIYILPTTIGLMPGGDFISNEQYVNCNT
jgi:hypothetical protein